MPFNIFITFLVTFIYLSYLKKHHTIPYNRFFPKRIDINKKRDTRRSKPTPTRISRLYIVFLPFHCKIY